MKTYVWRAICLWMISVVMGNAAGAADLIVYGGTGNIGSRIVKEALSRGHTVTVVARNIEGQQDTERLHYVTGDILDNADLQKKIAGKDVMISSINSGDTDFFLKAAQSTINALRADGAKAPRLIWVGGASSLEVEPGVRMIDQPGATRTGARLGHTQVLDYFRTLKDVRWTFVSPSMQISPGERTGKFRIGGDQLLKDAQGNSRISMEDFAVALIDEIEKPQQIGKRFTVGY